jgi:hypothetical protein
MIFSSLNRDFFTRVLLSGKLYSAVVLIVRGLQLDRADGRLTLFRALYSAVLVSAGGAVGAVIFWYAVSSPLIERQRKRSR